MAQVVLPTHYPSCHPTPKPPRRPKRKRDDDDDGDDGGNRNRHRNPNPHRPTATAPPSPPPPPCSNPLPSCSKDAYAKALGQFGVHLPAGYCFTPSIDELVGYYLLRKINGTLLPVDEALIPDCDVYGDEEPWEIWSRFRVAADDHRQSLFLLTRLKKRSRRIGTDGGTWHEESKKRHPVNGMIIKAVERQFTYRNIGSPSTKFPWLLKEFTLDNYPGDFAVCELRKKGCNSAVRSPDSGPSFAPPLTSHLATQSDPDPLPPSTLEDSEFEAELGRVLASIGGFSGCCDCEDMAFPPTSQLEETDGVPGKDEEGLINMGRVLASIRGGFSGCCEAKASTPTSPQLEETDGVPGKDDGGLINADASCLLESLGDIADELQVVCDGALIDLEFAPPKAKAG